MKNLRKLGAAIALSCVLGLTALAGETSTPPCALPEPGETSTPPCVEQPAPGDMETPTVASTAPGEVTLAGTETSFGEIAANALLTFLPLF